MLIYFCFLSVWLAAIALFIRSKFRADVLTIITPWQHCLAVASVDDGVSVTVLSPWPMPPRTQWTSDTAWLSRNTTDALLGPEINGLAPGLPSIAWLWHGFWFEKGSTWLYQFNGEFRINHPWRNDFAFAGWQPRSMVKLGLWRVSHAGVDGAGHFWDRALCLVHQNCTPPPASAIAATSRAVHPMRLRSSAIPGPLSGVRMCFADNPN